MGTPDSFTVIIPARNVRSTLELCLEAVFQASSLPMEVLVVDDGSSDGTGELALRYPCRVIRVNLGKGPMQARFAGAHFAQSPFLIFIDADVCIRQQTFSQILNHFKDPTIHAVTGLLARSTDSENFFSAYKSEYMHFIFNKQPRESQFLYGSLWAIRRESLIFFEPISEPFGSLVSDSEMGLRLTRQHKRVILDHSLEVRHLKQYSLAGILQNDFKIPFLFSLMLVRYAQGMPRHVPKCFSHVSLGQVLMAAVSFLTGVSAVAVLGTLSLKLAMFSLTGLSAVYIYWRGFLEGLAQRKGIGFLIKAMLFLPLDQAVMFCGMTAGFGWACFLFLRKLKKRLTDYLASRELLEKLVR